MERTHRSEDHVGICFNKTELIREVKTLQKIASQFLDSSTLWTLYDLESALEALGGGALRRIKLQELKTKPNEGAHEVCNRQGALNVFASITGCWDLRLDNKSVEFCGLASTKIELLDAITNQRMAMWRMEFGAHDAPGCYFHVQVLGDRNDPPFPRALPVPRLPSIFVSPMAAIEYVLGELFQDQWEKSIVQRRPDQDFWQKLQRDRLLSLLSWQDQELKRKSQSPPWMTLKSAKPDSKLFLTD